jgi:hypothetical protein
MIDHHAVGDEVGAWTIKACLEQGVEEQAAAHHDQHQPEGGPAVCQRHIDNDHTADKPHDGRAPQRRHIAAHLLEPGWAKRVIAVGRIAQSQQDRLVEGTRIPFDDLAGQLDEKPQA